MCVCVCVCADCGRLGATRRYEYKWGHAMVSCAEVDYRRDGVNNSGIKNANGLEMPLYPIVLIFHVDRVRQMRILYATSEGERTTWGQALDAARQGPASPTLTHRVCVCMCVCV
jgi:hypothetical protein